MWMMHAPKAHNIPVCNNYSISCTSVFLKTGAHTHTHTYNGRLGRSVEMAPASECGRISRVVVRIWVRPTLYKRPCCSCLAKPPDIYQNSAGTGIRYGGKKDPIKPSFPAPLAGSKRSAGFSSRAYVIPQQRPRQPIRDPNHAGPCRTLILGTVKKETSIGTR